MEDCNMCKIWKALYCILLDKYTILAEFHPAQSDQEKFIVKGEQNGAISQKEFIVPQSKTPGFSRGM